MARKTPEEARKQYANFIEQRRSARSEKTKTSLDKYKGMISSRRKYGDVLRAQMSSRENMRAAEQERERRKRASVWSNLALMGTGIGSVFGPIGSAVGTALGAGVGMISSAARGGNPFDMSAQFEYLDPGMLGFAAQGVAGAIKGSPAQAAQTSSLGMSPGGTAQGGRMLTGQTGGTGGSALLPGGSVSQGLNSSTPSFYGGGSYNFQGTQQPQPLSQRMAPGGSQLSLGTGRTQQRLQQNLAGSMYGNNRYFNGTVNQ